MTPRLIEAIFYPTGTHDTMYNRSYRPGYRNRGAIDRFLEETNEGRNVNNVTMSRIADEIITLTAEVDPDRSVIIPNGFQNERMAFTMLIETDRIGDDTKYQLITGFTDRLDISSGDHLAPDTRLYINNTSSYRSTWVRGRRSIVTDDNSYILRGTRDLLGESDGRRLREDPVHYVRPSDIYYNLSAPGILHRLSPSGETPQYSDVRSRSGSEYARTRRSYDAPSAFLAQTIRAGIAGRRSHEDRAQSRDHDDVDYNNYMGQMSAEDTAASILESQDVGRNEVFRRLLDVSDFIRIGGLTLEELEDAIDFRDGEVRVWEIGARRRVSDSTEGRRLSTARRGEGREWHGADDNTMAAEMAARIVPSLLMLNTVGCAVVNISNDTYDGQVRCSVTGVGPLISQLEITGAQITAIEEQLTYDLGNVVSNNGRFRFNMKVDVEMYGSCRIDVWVDDPSTRDEFVYPVYADCLCSAQITDDENTVADIATDIGSLLDALDDVDAQKRGRHDILTPDRHGNY